MCPPKNKSCYWDFSHSLLLLSVCLSKETWVTFWPEESLVSSAHKKVQKMQDYGIIRRSQGQDWVYPTNTMSLGVWVKINVITKWYDRVSRCDLKPNFLHDCNSRETFLVGNPEAGSEAPEPAASYHAALSSWRITGGVALQGDSTES